MGSKLISILTASIIKKQVTAITGLLLCGFLVVHMAGNFFIMAGPEAFNQYAYALKSNPLIVPAQILLYTLFLTHILLTIRLTVGNYNARPQKYFMRKKSGHGSTFASSSMPITGTLTLVFLIIHLINFKFGPVYTTYVDGVEMRDIYRTVIEYFGSPLSVLWYLLAMLFLAIHLSHGFWSALQSLGLNHPRYNNGLKNLSKAFALFIFFGFSSFPIYCYLIQQGAV